uniref:Cilia- and flagella-associated protein 299 n=1 Tax=Mesocestoides corti TaxID=53468 RepID=A0A5K3FJV7_MESCO
MSKGRSEGLDRIAEEFEKYEDFLDSQITDTDMFYLEDETLARELVELGYRGTGEIITREDFNQKKKELAIQEEKRKMAKKALDHEGLIITEASLTALAAREESNRRGNLSTIIYIRDRNARGQEISGYIDYAHRLKHEDFGPYFSGKKKLMPRVDDLSYYNWESQSVYSNSTSNYIVIADNPSGLLFKNKKDRKLVVVDPWAPTAGDNTSRTSVYSAMYLQFVLYDHVTRRKT